MPTPSNPNNGEHLDHMAELQKTSPEIVASLTSLLGKERVVVEHDALVLYGQDETEDYVFPPDVVVKPETPQEISAIMRIATASGIPVTPRGGGTGLSGGALPIHGGICLSMERFDKILTIDAQNFQAEVEPGVTTQRLQEEVEKLGLFYPPDPSSRGTSHMGGNVSENAGGPRAVKYGVTRDYILAFEAVLPTGEIIRTGAGVLKNSTGYNLTQLLIGSEGTLAIITKIRVKLIPLPRLRRLVLVPFDSLESAASAVAAIFQRGITPSALEFMERSAVKAAEDKLQKNWPNGDAGAQLLIEVDGNHEDLLMEQLGTIAEVVEQFGAQDVVLADDPVKVADIWALRRSIGEAVKSISAYKEEDTVVPRAELPKLVRGVKEICGRYGITAICYGHAGDGNCHVNILKGNLTDEVWNKQLDEAIREIFHYTVSLGGTISGEHGIGYSQRGYLSIAIGETERRLMREIKKTFDPAGILNPGKILG